MREALFRATLAVPLLLVSVVAGMVPPMAHAFDGKPVKIIAAFPPGGGADGLARLIQEKLGARLQAVVVVENKPGASGNIASEYVARSAPDGNTLLMHNNTLTINSALGVRQPFELRDLRPIAAIASTPVVIAVNSSLPVRTVNDLIEYAKKEGRLTFSSCGNGTAHHFAGIYFSNVAKLEFVHVPYKGCGPAVVDGLSGQVPIMFTSYTNVSSQVQAGKIRLIAVGSKQRSSNLPDLPTISETPGFAAFETDVWIGLLAPSGIRNDIAQRLEADVLATVREPEIQRIIAERGYSTTVLDSKQFAEQISADVALWKRLATQFNVTLE